MGFFLEDISPFCGSLITLFCESPCLRASSPDMHEVNFTGSSDPEVDCIVLVVSN